MTHTSYSEWCRSKQAKCIVAATPGTEFRTGIPSLLAQWRKQSPMERLPYAVGEAAIAACITAANNPFSDLSPSADNAQLASRRRRAVLRERKERGTLKSCHAVWTPDNTEHLRSLLAAGMLLKEVAQRMGYTIAGLRSRMQRLKMCGVMTEQEVRHYEQLRRDTVRAQRLADDNCGWPPDKITLLVEMYNAQSSYRDMACALETTVPKVAVLLHNLARRGRINTATRRSGSAKQWPPERRQRLLDLIDNEELSFSQTAVCMGITRQSVSFNYNRFKQQA